jgi:ferredoxin
MSSKEEETMETEMNVYRRLQVSLDTMPVGFPATESGVEIRLLQQLFTAREAEIALNLSALPEELGKIYRRVKHTGISREKLEEMLDRLAAKGAIMGGPMLAKGRQGKYYSKAQLAVGMFEFQVDRITKEFAEDFYRYEKEGFQDELFGGKTRQIRTIPVNESIKNERYVAQYDDTRALVTSSPGPRAVINCICRQAKDKLGDPCRQTDIRETCIVFEEFASMSISHGIGRELSKEETLELLDRAEVEGMVLQPENNQHPKFICACCGDCCSVLTAVKEYPRPADLYHTNYQAAIDGDLCTGCGICVERCQMEAVVVSNGAAAVDLDRCIGCGLCTTTCESHAMTLVRKERQTRPPKDHDAMYRRIMMQKLGPWGTMKMMGKSLLGKKI